MSDEQPSSPIHSDDEIKSKNNHTNGSNVVARRERPSRACTVRSAARIHEAAVAEAAVVSTTRKQKPRRRPRREVEEEEEEEEEPPPSPPNPYSNIITPLVSEPESSQLPRWEIRSMWELASVLNFLNVFRPLLNIKVEFSVEELETALISPNNTLGEVHIPLLKAIPPVTRMALSQNTWVTVLCRKLRDWWHWVSEGELPIVASHGTEIDTYNNTLDPRVRVIILKALCDIRVEQDDIRSYIDDSIKHGVPLSAFRKERTGGDSHGVSYWYEDDPIIGQRLYREIRKTEVKKGKGKNVISVPSYQWETVSTNLDEFQDVSEKLFSSKNRTESSLGKKLKNDMLPEIEKVQKRKEKLLKKQHRQALLLDGMIVDGLGGRSLRGRKQVSYTFDDYDRSINEAIKITKRKQPSPEHIVRREGLRHENGRWGPPAPTNNSHNSTFTPPSPDSLNYDESDSDRKSEQLDLDRSNRRRQRPQRYSTREFVEAVSDNEADMDSDYNDDDDDDDIVGEAVYDEEYLKKRKERRKVSSSSEGDEEYKWDGDNGDEEEEYEDEGDESLNESEEEDSDDNDSPKRFKKLPSRTGRTRFATKSRSVNESKLGPRRSRRSTRNRIDYKQYEFSDSEPESESAKPETSNSFDKQSEPSEKSSEKSGFSMGSSDENESENNNNDGNFIDNEIDNGNDNDNDNDDEIDDEEVKIEGPTIQEHEKIEREEENGTTMKIDSPNEDEFENGARKRRFLDLNELAPGSGFEDGSIKDDDTDNF